MGIKPRVTWGELLRVEATQSKRLSSSVQERKRETSMKVCAAKSMPRLAVKARRTRCTMSVSKSSQNKQRVSVASNGKTNQVAMAMAMATLTASSPALASVNDVAQVAGAEFLPSIFVPLVGLVFPGVAMAAFFIYSAGEDIS